MFIQPHTLATIYKHYLQFSETALPLLILQKKSSKVVNLDKTQRQLQTSVQYCIWFKYYAHLTSTYIFQLSLQAPDNYSQQSS